MSSIRRIETLVIVTVVLTLRREDLFITTERDEYGCRTGPQGRYCLRGGSLQRITWASRTWTTCAGVTSR